jgi:ABC-type dipeptide/oligopeptide/nickel transport system permease component
MGKLFVTRVLQAIFTLWVVSVVVFFSARITGTPDLALMPPDALPKDREAFKQAYGLDQPLIVQYGRWLSRALQGDLGKGIQHRLPVVELIAPRLINSIKLAAVGMGMAVLLAVPLGVMAAVKRGQIWDRIAMGIGLGGQALPSFWLALMLVLVFSVRLKWLPATGSGTWQHYILPGFTLGWFITAGATRLVRSSMLEVLDTEFVKLARSKGVAEAWVIWKHALRNALIPVVTFIGFMFGVIIASSITTETVFVWPGIGRLVFEALLARDFPVIQGIVLIWSAIIIFLNLLVDLAYGFLDPRIRS